MPTEHPSGRPRRSVKRGTASIVRWPREGYLNPRLDNPRELSGGFGFRMPDPQHDHLHGVALARGDRGIKDR